MASPPRAGVPERAVATIDVGAVERNCRRLVGSLAGGSELCAVVKTDGYGHGAAGCARAALEGGATMLGVVSAAEAVALPESEPEAPLLVMGAMTGGELEAALAANAEVGAWDAGFVDECSRLAASLGRRVRVHVKADTGMGRLGTRDPDEALRLTDLVAQDPHLEAAGLWTHFATADEPDSDGGFFDLQLERFAGLAERVRERHPGVRVHAANSAATLRDPAAHFDLVRCGIAIYGLDPFGRDAASQGLEPALELRSYIAAVKRFETGSSVGYGRRWSAPVDTWVAVVPIGYGDGVRRALGNNADVLIGGRRRPVVGTVSMDNITVDLGPDPGGVAVGEEVVLIGERDGERISCEEMAVRLGTITYEVTTGLTGRVRRLIAR